MKKILKAINVAFSMYSKIPMPKFMWESEDMKYHLCFFPWVGTVIGSISFLLFWSQTFLQLQQLTVVMLAMAIPLLITGGFHLDGFMDTCDAIHSYQDREKKLAILKDPHIGAFSVICLLCLALLTISFGMEVTGWDGKLSICFSYFIARCLSGISVTYFPKAKADGMVSTSAKTSDSKVVLVSLIVQLLIAIMLLEIITLPYGYAGVVSVVVIFLCFAFYSKMSKKEFGGITGDLAGYFVVIAEAGVVIGCSILELLLRLI